MKPINTNRNNIYSVIGYIKEIFEEKEGENLKGIWKNITFILEAEEAKRQHLKFLAWKKNVPIVNCLNIGEKVEVTFIIKARKGSNGWYNELVVIDIY